MKIKTWNKSLLPCRQIRLGRGNVSCLLTEVIIQMQWSKKEIVEECENKGTENRNIQVEHLDVIQDLSKCTFLNTRDTVLHMCRLNQYN